MGVNVARFYGRERMVMPCEILTPMFLGGADQEAELRAASFRGLLRYWWRLAEAYRFNDSASLYHAESMLFGSPDDSGGKSRVTVQLLPVNELEIKRETFSDVTKVNHPEVHGGKVKALNYLAGMGLINFKKGIQHSYFCPGGQFQMRLIGPAAEITSTMALFRAFAAAGGRSRNGWGSLAVGAGSDAKITLPQNCLIDFDQAFARDYPHGLGRDRRGHLIWHTNSDFSSWEQCLGKLAEIYVKTRLALNIKGHGKQDRHLLGYPVTNHAVNDWKNRKLERHASALRLLVRKNAAGRYVGFIVHIPHLFSRKMWSELPAEAQKSIWRRVHAQLDALMQRASVEVLL